MIVTLGALQARAEKHLGRGSAARGRIALRTVIVRGRTAVSTAPGGDQLADELIQRFVFSHALANPMMEVLHTLLIERVCFHTQQVRPFQRPKIGELRALEQLIDQTSALSL